MRDEDVVLEERVEEGDGGVEPVERIDGGEQPGVAGAVSYAVDLHGADDDADAEEEGAEEERFCRVYEGVLEVWEVEYGAC